MVLAVCPKVLGVPQLPCLLLDWCREPRNFPFLQSKMMAWPESWRAGAALQCRGGFALLSAVSKHLGTAGWQDGLVNVCDAKGAHNSRPQHAAGSQPLPGGLHICPAQGPGLGEARSGHSPREGREGALCSLDCLHHSRQPWDVLSRTLPCPCPPAGDSRLECLSLSDPGPRLPGQLCTRHRLPLQPRKPRGALRCQSGRVGSS